MRLALAAFAALNVCACVDIKPGADGDPAGGAVDGYTLEVRANEDEQVYLVTSPEGRTVAARAGGGASTLIDQAALRTLLAAAPEPGAEAQQEVVSLRMPGINLSVSGDGEGEGGEGGGRVSVNIGGRSVEVNARDGGPGADNDRANVRITGVPEAEAREFIAKADQLSPAVQAQMLTELGLE